MGCAKRAVGTRLASTKPSDRMLNVPRRSAAAKLQTFTFMTPEGHALSAWITFSAHQDGGVTVAQVQALERTSDPIIELTYLLGANRANDRFWEQTLGNLARAMGAEGPVVTAQKLIVDPKRQWRYVRNLRFSPAISMVVGTLTAPVRLLRRRRSAG